MVNSTKSELDRLNKKEKESILVGRIPSSLLSAQLLGPGVVVSTVILSKTKN